MTKRPILLVVGMIALTASVPAPGAWAEDVARTIQGKWALDRKAQIERWANYKDAGAEERQRAAAALEDVSVEFTRNRMTIAGPGWKDGQGPMHPVSERYRVVGVEGTRVRIKSTSDLWTVEVLGPDSIVLRDSWEKEWFPLCRITARARGCPGPRETR